MKALNKAEILARTSLFRNITKDNLSALAGICLSKTLKKKDLLFQEGEKGLSIFVLIYGSIQLYKITPDGRETVIKLIKPGEVFAEAVLFESAGYPVNAIALSTSQIYILPKHQLFCLLENDNFRKDFLGMMMKKVRYLTNQINYLSSHDVEERLFLFLEEQYGQRTVINISLSKKDIAAAIRTTPETLSRLFLRLKKEGKLVWEGKSITVPQIIWETVNKLK